MDRDSMVAMHGGPFGNRETILAEIRYWGKGDGVLELLGVPFFALGIIGDALNITIVLEPMSWFLMAIFAVVGSIGTTLHVVVAEHVLGLETESKEG